MESPESTSNIEEKNMWRSLNVILILFMVQKQLTS